MQGGSAVQGPAPLVHGEYSIISLSITIIMTILMILVILTAIVIVIVIVIVMSIIGDYTVTSGPRRFGRASERDKWGQHYWGHCKVHVF